MNHIAATQAAEDALSATDLSEAVRATAMLADVTISLWGAERTDHAIMERAKRDAGATGNVGRAVKNLLAGVDGPLKATRSAFAAVRTKHYEITLPWVTDPHAERQRGPRLLPTMLFEKYITEMNSKKREALTALDAFIAEYPDLVIQARANLGGLADADYPDAVEVKRHFRVAFDFEPIPAGAAFRGLPDHMIDKLSRNLAERQKRMLGAATKAMWEEVGTRVRHVVGRLSDPEARFKVSTIESARELAVLLPGWNVTNDPRAHEIAYDIDRMLAGVDADAIRKDETVRKEVATQAQGVADKLTAWGL